MNTRFSPAIKSFSAGLGLLVAFLPILNDVAASEAPNRIDSGSHIVRSIDVTQAAAITPGGAAPEVNGHFDLTVNADGNDILYGAIKSGPDVASFSVDRAAHKLTLGDGITISARTVSTDGATQHMLYTVTDPASNLSATATISWNHETGAAAVVGMDAIRDLLKNSHELDTLRSALPALLSRLAGRHHVHVEGLECFFAEIGYAAAVTGFTLACLTPLVVIVVDCVLATATLAAATVALASACGTGGGERLPLLE